MAAAAEVVSSNEGTMLTLGQVQKALSHLGHTERGEIAYTQCVLSSLQLSSLAPLAGFPFLQRLTLDGNRLVTLQPLEHLGSLVYLSARSNCLTAAGVFPFLSSSCTSLEHLHLDHNELHDLTGLATLPYLVDLSVSHNQLTALTATDFLPLRSLTRLAASANAIEVVEPNTFSGATFVRTVDLTGNRLADLAFVAYLTTHLETLLVASNQLLALGSPLAACTALVTLDVSTNMLPSVEELVLLQPLPLLRHLRVVGNPFWVSDDRAEGDTASVRDTGSGAESVKTKTEFTASDVAAAPTGQQEIVVKDAADLEAEEAAAALLPSEGMSFNEMGARELDYTALAAPAALSVVRRVLTASHMAPVPGDLDRQAELVKLPPATQIFLLVVFLLPSLASLNNVAVLPRDVAKAQFFFTELSS